MPEDQVEQPSGGLEKILTDLTSKATGKSEDSKGSPLLVYLILTALVVIGFAIMGWLVVRAKRRAAQIEYELRKKEEEQKRLEEQVRLDQNAETRAQAEVQINELNVGIQELKEQAKVVEGKAQERATALAQMASWDDLVVVDRRKQ